LCESDLRGWHTVRCLLILCVMCVLDSGNEEPSDGSDEEGDEMSAALKRRLAKVLIISQSIMFS